MCFLCNYLNRLSRNFQTFLCIAALRFEDQSIRKNRYACLLKYGSVGRAFILFYFILFYFIVCMCVCVYVCVFQPEQLKCIFWPSLCVSSLDFVFIKEQES